LTATGKPRRKETSKKDKVAECTTGAVQEVIADVLFSGVKKKTSIRIDSKLWNTFILKLKNNGLSSCFVLERFITAFVLDLPLVAVHCPTFEVNVDMPRIVKRVRRRQIYWEDETYESVMNGQDRQLVLKCGFCGKEAVATAVHEESGKKVFVCKYHKECLSEHPKWKVNVGS